MLRLDDGKETVPIDALLFAGIDWGSRIDDVCVLDRNRRKIATLESDHNGLGAQELADRLVEMAGGIAGNVAVALETPHGILVDTFLSRGIQVYSLNPKQVDRFRERRSISGAKTDPFDAFVIVDGLITDGHLFHRIEAENPLVVQLRDASRLEEELGQEVLRLCNRVREQLTRYMPAVLDLSPAVDDPWIWTLLEAAPTAKALRSLKSSRIRDILKSHRIRKFKEKEVEALLKRDPLPPIESTAKAAADHVQVLLPMVKLAHAQRLLVDKRLSALLEQFKQETATEDDPGDPAIVLSFPGIAKKVGAIILGEAYSAISKRDIAGIRTLGGVAPVTKRSGQAGGKRSSGRVMMRRACSERLRYGLYHWSRVAAQTIPASREAYERLRASGHKHGRALRSVADQLLRMLNGALASRTLFDPARVGAKARAATQACTP